MKRYLIISALICSFTTLKVYAQADQRTLTTKIADLLAKVPFNDAAQSEKICRLLRKWEKPVCRKWQPCLLHLVKATIQHWNMH